MARPRAADDFAAIRARMEEIQRERQPSSAEPEHNSETSRSEVDRKRAARIPMDLLRYRWRL